MWLYKMERDTRGGTKARDPLRWCFYSTAQRFESSGEKAGNGTQSTQEETRLWSCLRAVLQFTGVPKLLNRPSTITRSPSGKIIPNSYFNVGGVLLMRLNRQSRPGALGRRLTSSSTSATMSRPGTIGRRTTS